MANIYFTETAQFRPFSYQEMLAPILAYKEQYDALETEMTNLDILASDIESKLTQNPEDAELRDVYNRFNTDMQSALNSFYSEGYTADTKRKLNTLKARYSKELNPINEAYKAYQEDQKYLTKFKREHPEVIIEGLGNSISDYMHGNTPAGISANLNTITESSRVSAAGLSKQFTDNIELQNVDGYIGRYLIYGKTQGISPDMVKDFTDFVDSKEALTSPGGKALYTLFEKERAASNYYRMSPNAQKQINASIIKGLVQGVSYDEDIKYIGDNYWDIENKKQNIDLTKAKLRSLRAKNRDINNTDVDLRTNTTMYSGKNADVSQIAKLMEEQFEKPIEYNGTKIYDPIQAYNIIHKDDSRIAELQSVYDAKKEQLDKKISIDPLTGEPLTLIEKIMSDPDAKLIHDELSALKMRKNASYRALEGIALTEKEVDRIREYSNSSATGVLTPKELESFATILESDFSTFEGAQKTATVFSQTNSKDGLEDMVKTISNNVMQEWQKGHSLKITTPEGKEIKNKEFEKLIDSETKALDLSKISSIELDFISAERGAVKLVTTEGKVYYVDSDYIGDQANAFIKGETGLFSIYQQLLSQDISKVSKAEILNRALGINSGAIQSQYTKNRDKSMSDTLSDKFLFE